MAETATKALPRLTIDHSGKELPGLLIRYTEQPRGFNFSDAMTFLFGVGLILIGMFALYGNMQLPIKSGYLFLFSIGIMLLPGIGVVYYSFKYRTRLRNGLKIQYRVTVEDGMATFFHDDGTTTLDISKISRIWIARDTMNGIVTRADVMAFCNGKLAVVCDVMEISRLLGDDDNLLVTSMVDYLNTHLKAGQPEIRAGFKPGYAVERI